MVWVYTFLVVLGTFLAVLGITSTNVAIPKMIAPLQTDIYGIQWVPISYIVATAITIVRLFQKSHLGTVPPADKGTNPFLTLSHAPLREGKSLFLTRTTQ
jgi:hypothetical protein